MTTTRTKVRSRYQGVLGADHWSSVVQVAIGSHPLMASLPEPGLPDIASLGGSILHELAWSAPLEDAAVLGDRAHRRLPLTLGLGAMHVLAAQAELGTTEHRAVRLGAALHASAAVIDHVVDETNAGDDLRRALRQDLVQSFFTSEPQWAERLALARATPREPLTGLVLDLLYNCGRDAWALRSQAAASADWSHLARLLTDLTRFELAVGDPGPLARVARSRVTSVGLSQALGEVAILPLGHVTTPPRLSEVARLRRRMEVLGEVLWIVDDMVDLLEDDRRGHPNGILDADPAPSLSDADLYRHADEAASRLAERLGALGHGPIADLAARVTALWGGRYEPTHPTCAPRGPSKGKEPDDGHPRRVTAARTTAFLVQATAAGLEGHAHRLRLPRAEPQVREVHESVVMVRGVVLDALLDAREAGLSVPRWLIDREVMMLLRSKHPLVRGGWSYLPTVPELPPDIDDLGQVLQVLARVGGADLAATGLEGARLAVDKQEPGGGIGTWVIDPRGSGPADSALSSYLPVMGGCGVHPDAVANLALGLLTVDPVRWSAPLHQICRYLGTIQNADGSWASQWYAGPWYGTHRALAVLSRMRSEDTARTAAVRFLLDSQVDGGWGVDGTDPLATALAVLGLREAVGNRDRRVHEGVRRLTELCNDSGAWEERPWIVFPTLDGPVSYGSSVVTTAFCLKALADPEGPR